MNYIYECCTKGLYVHSLPWKGVSFLMCNVKSFQFLYIGIFLSVGFLFL